MPLVSEFRIVTPFTPEEYATGSLFSVAKESDAQTRNGEGVEVVVNEAYERDGGSGQYTEKLIHLGSKLPSILAKVLPGKALLVEEKSWNSFPSCDTHYTCPYFGEKFRMRVRTLHVADDGRTENALGLGDADLARRTVEVVDVAGAATWGPPLAHVRQPPVTCAYKVVFLEVKAPAVQDALEKIVMQRGMKDVLLDFHKKMVAWAGEWRGMSEEDVRAVEKAATERQNKALAASGVGRGAGAGAQPAWTMEALTLGEGADGVALPVPKSRWMRDEDAPSCVACRAAFSFVRRRHHCRCCGKVFCGDCSGHTREVLGLGTGCRVCDGCARFIDTLDL